MATPKTIREQLEAAIRASGKSWYELSKETGVSLSQISRFMNGKSDMNLRSAGLICKVLKLSLKR